VSRSATWEAGVTCGDQNLFFFFFSVFFFFFFRARERFGRSSSSGRERRRPAGNCATARFSFPFAAGSRVDVPPTRMIADTIAFHAVSTLWRDEFVVSRTQESEGALGRRCDAYSLWFRCLEPRHGCTFLVTKFLLRQLAPALRPNLGFRSEHDRLPVSMIGERALGVAGSRRPPPPTFHKLIAEARAKPGRLRPNGSVASALQHLVRASFADSGGRRLVHVALSWHLQAA